MYTIHVHDYARANNKLDEMKIEKLVLLTIASCVAARFCSEARRHQHRVSLRPPLRCIFRSSSRWLDLAASTRGGVSMSTMSLPVGG